MNNLVPVVSSPDCDLSYLPALRVQEIIAIWKESGLREILKNHINKKQFGKNKNENKDAILSD